LRESSQSRDQLRQEPEHAPGAVTHGRNGPGKGQMDDRARAGDERIDRLVGDHARLVSDRLLAHRAQLFPPDAQKVLRPFSSGEVAALLGVNDAYLRKLSLDGRGPQP